MDTQKTFAEIRELEQEIMEEKVRCIPPDNLHDTPVERLKFKSYGNALVFFSRVKEREQKIQTLRDILKVCT